jgi:orotidine-5'-phosphate decarboxylase
MNLEPRERLIVPLDFPAADEALEFVNKMGDVISFYKVGLELFYAAGPDIVRHLKAIGKSVFLDSKFHDIPNTVAGAASRAVAMNVDMFNVHALGGKAMMRAAAEAVSRTAAELGTEPPIVLGVTVLTSLDRETLEKEIGVTLGKGINAFVAAKAQQAKEAGLDGVVASPNEVADIRNACGDSLHIVTPGVRPTWASTDDQKRVATPSEAITMGADRIVVGRPITRARDPIDAARKIIAEIS